MLLYQDPIDAIHFLDASVRALIRTRETDCEREDLVEWANLLLEKIASAPDQEKMDELHRISVESDIRSFVHTQTLGDDAISLPSTLEYDFSPRNSPVAVEELSESV